MICSPLPCRPHYIPQARLRGVKAKGITFEKRVGKVLRGMFSEVRSGVWFEYHTQTRSGVCCMDHFVVLPSHIILVECKLSEKDTAWAQMNLYAPLLAAHYGKAVARVQATRHLRTGRKLIEDVALAKPDAEHLWHVLV